MATCMKTKALLTPVSFSTQKNAFGSADESDDDGVVRIIVGYS